MGERAKRKRKREGGKDGESTSSPSLLLLFGSRFSTNTYHAPRIPAVVTYPESTEDVVKVSTSDLPSS